VTPHPGDAFADLGDVRADAPRTCLTRLVERPPDRYERDRRGEIRDGVDQKRQEALDGVEHATERRPDEPCRRDTRRVLRERLWQVVLCDEVPHGADLGDREEDGEGPLRGRSDQQVRVRQVIACERRDDAAEHEGRAETARDHQPPAIDSVDDRAGRQCEHEPRRPADEAEDARERRGVRELERKERIRDAARPRSEVRERLADPVAAEVGSHRACSGFGQRRLRLRRRNRS
jgi:hypothetical protein